jgi:hypothetical protein
MTDNSFIESEVENTLPEYKKDYSFNYSEMNYFNIVLFIISFLFFGGIFILIWGLNHTWHEANEYIFNAFITIPVIIGGIFLHEGLHALTLLLFSNTKIKDLKAGINWINFTPYIHCKHAVSVSKYRISSASPAIILGIVPVILGISIGFFPFLFFGIIFIITAGADILSILKIRKVKGNYLASDHPDKAGCTVFENPFENIN